MSDGTDESGSGFGKITKIPCAFGFTTGLIY